MLTLNTEIIKINRVGAATAKRLNRIGIETVEDLLFYFPFRYEDFLVITPIDKLVPGTSANVVGRIELIQNKRSHRKRMYITEALVSDKTESIKVVWFNQPFIAKNLRVGDTVSLAGKVSEDFSGPIMNSPNYEKVTIRGAVHTQGIVPMYRLTANITQKQIRFLIKQIIKLSNKLPDWLPGETQKNQKLLSLDQAIEKIHFPSNMNDIEKAKERLAFNELFLLQLQSQIIKHDLEKAKATPIPFKEKQTKDFVDSLPFQLTDAQKKSAWQILLDTKENKPMARMLNGDVGSGKTVVAAIAMLNAALNNVQSVLMVPTEILAKQHYDTLCKLFEKNKIKIGLITRSDKKTNFDKETRADSISQNTQILVGTHALIQEKIEFSNLGLAIIDEQHRFGVEQRKTLIEKSGNKKTIPHLLSMTATPIPRSLALALYGDLEISVINEMPKNRKPIITQVVSEANRQKAYQFIQGQIDQGRQVFVICPLIDISDKLGVKSVKEEFEKLDKQVFPHLTIGYLHGRMKSKEKEDVMKRFLNNKTQILVSTSVVEVGIDVPNASIMIIEGADRFGLAQLHQFRGRVGRGEHQSYCFLFSETNNERTMKRLQVLTNSYDGLSLAKADLKFRGPGEIYGTHQKGFPEMKVASIFDYELMKRARTEAISLLDTDKDLGSHPALKQKNSEQNKIIHPE
ncbi:ATP-dependent DNA helicase RecG [Patescibacteria group bacterium]